MTVVLDTRTVDPRERFDFWVEGAQSIFFPLGCRRIGDDAAPFSGFIRRHQLGPVVLTQVVTEPTSISRTRAHVLAHDPQSIAFSYVRRGLMVFSQNGRQTRVAPGEIFVNDESSPMELRTPQHTEQLVLQAPKGMFGEEAEWVRANAGRIVSPALTRALLAPIITGLADGLVAGDVHDGDATLGEGVLDLMRAACREPGTVVAAAPTNMRVLEIKRYVDQHIGDPALSPDAIAAAHFMSVRTLQKLFRAEGRTVSEWIRMRRLEGTRRDLRDPRLAELSIAQIADSWGLPNPGHFSRMFRAEFGLTPRECRGSAAPR
jgi:AraC-like DNA-binding protein